MDLGEAASRHRWRQIIDLLSQLPQGSRTWDAMVHDPQASEEIASMMLAARQDDDPVDGSQQRKGLPARDWTPEVAAIGALYDLVAAVAGAKRVKFPRPERTLVDDAMARQQADMLYDVIAMMTPHALPSRTSS